METNLEGYGLWSHGFDEKYKDLTESHTCSNRSMQCLSFRGSGLLDISHHAM